MSKALSSQTKADVLRNLDLTPTGAAGTLFELRMTRASKAARGTRLIWAAPPDHFIFIDADLNSQRPGNATLGGVTTSGKRN